VRFAPNDRCSCADTQTCSAAVNWYWTSVTYTCLVARRGCHLRTLTVSVIRLPTVPCREAIWGYSRHVLWGGGFATQTGSRISKSPQVLKCHTPYRRLKSVQRCHGVRGTKIKKKDKGNPYCGKHDVRRGVHPPSNKGYLLPSAGSPFLPLPSRLLPFLSPSLPSPSFASLLFPSPPCPFPNNG